MSESQSNQNQNSESNIQASEAFSLLDNLNLPREYFSVDQPKREISKLIHSLTQNSDDLSLRGIAENLKELYPHLKPTPHRNTVRKITSGQNYTIDNLLMVLDAIGYKLTLTPRTEEEEEAIRNGKLFPQK